MLGAASALEAAEGHGAHTCTHTYVHTCVHTYTQLVSGLAHPGSGSPAGAVLALLVSAEPCREDADIMLLLLHCFLKQPN